MAAASGSDQRIKKGDFGGPTIGGDRINPRAPVRNPSPWMTIVSPGLTGGCREVDERARAQARSKSVENAPRRDSRTRKRALLGRDALAGRSGFQDGLRSPARCTGCAVLGTAETIASDSSR